MMLFCRNFFVSIFVKIIIIMYFVFTPSRPSLYTLHSDEVVSLLISGCEKCCTL